MKKTADTVDALKRANDLISALVNALDAVVRAETLAYAQGAAEQAMKHANSQRVRNTDGYLAVR